ncbi:MAG: DegV family protein [Ruminococcus sp.]|nr:DegV family protein [Ruminococcus sp.]
MTKIKIITDSASDITMELGKELGITVLPLTVMIGDKSYVSGVDFTNDQFYEMMDNYEGVPKTSQVTLFAYKEAFEQAYKEGYTDIINVTINSQGSGGYNNSVMAAEEFFEENPDAKGKVNIFNLDSRSYSAGYGYPVIEAAKKAEKGCSAQEIVDYIQDWIAHLSIFFAPYSLKYAKKSGRIPSAAAFVGEVMGLRPIMRIEDWKITTETKVRGDKAIIPKLIECCEKEQIPKTPYCVVYGNDLTIRDDFIKALTQKFGYPPAEVFQVGAAIAINAGPRVAGLIFKAQR